MQSSLNEPEPDDAWTQIAPLLSAALGQIRCAGQKAAIAVFVHKLILRPHVEVWPQLISERVFG